jgi:two-component system response regulator YesN
MGVFFNFKLFTESKLNRSLLFKYFKAYIILLLILCLSTCIIYGIMNRSLKEQIVRVNNVLIQNIANFLEKEFTNLDELITLINSNSKIIKYMNMQYEHFSPYVNYSAYEVLKDIAAYVNSNNFIDNIYIFFNNESVISNTYKADNGYYYKNLDKNQFNNIDLINSYNFKNIFYVHDNKENAKIYYANTLPLGSRNVHKATIIIQIDSEFIKSRIRDNQFTEKTEIIILNSERASIMKYSLSNISFRDKELVMTSVKSDMLKWEIVSQIPKTQFEAKLIYIRSAIIFILLFALLIGIACAIYFSYKNYKPIVKLIETLEM